MADPTTEIVDVRQHPTTKSGFDEWWDKNYEDTRGLGADRTFGEEVWNAAQEAVLMPLLAAGDEKSEEITHAG